MGNERRAGERPVQDQEHPTPHPELIKQLADRDKTNPEEFVRTLFRLALVKKDPLVEQAGCFLIIDVHTRPSGNMGATVHCTYDVLEDGEAFIVSTRERQTGTIYYLYTVAGQPCPI